jgi:thiamine phosphate synthase YjbQ (UPF0047 family)
MKKLLITLMIITSIFISGHLWGSDYSSSKENEKIFKRIRQTQDEINTEIVYILERCKEFIRDGDTNYLPASTTLTLLIYTEPHRTLKDDIQDEFDKVLNEKEKLDRETELRHDIDIAIKELSKKLNK